jgi:hypothetical protein
VLYLDADSSHGGYWVSAMNNNRVGRSWLGMSPIPINL